MKRRAPESSGAKLASVIEALPEASLNEVASAIRVEAKARGFYLEGPSNGHAQEGARGHTQEGTRENGQRLIPLAMTPWVIRPETARYLKSLFRGIRRTVNRILAHYFEDPKLQAILPLRESELAWLKDSCSDGIPRPQTIFERFDTNLGPEVEQQLDAFQIIEFNAVGVGCIYLMPAATEIIEAHLLPALKERCPFLSLVRPADYRQLLLEELKSHSKAIGRPDCQVALVERRETTPGGVDEFEKLASYFKDQGLKAIVGDPREVERFNGELVLKGQPVDVVYRDFQLEEVVSIKTHGGNVEGIEAAFARNQVVSTVFGEFDHKSLCELLTNPDFAGYLTPQEIRAARRRIPWTRLVEERRTTDPQGKEVDLLPYIRDHRQTLVLKPNRGYGGEGVVVGQEATTSGWEEALEKAVSKPKTWVVQERIPIAKAPVALVKERGQPVLSEQYVTLSVTATPRGVAFVGRSSTNPVVNISQGGGLVPIFLSK